MAEFQPLALWNGELLPLADVRVSVLDRAYLFGDGVYEVLRLYAGRPFLLQGHEERLERSLRELMIEPPPGRLGDKIERLCAASGVKDGSVYIQISRGEGPRSHVPPPGLRPNELLFVQELPPGLTHKVANGIRMLLADDLRWGRCDVKSLNLLGNCLAAMQAKAAGFDEAVLVDRDGYVTEGSHTSFFGVRGGGLVTPPLTANILPGVTRNFLVAEARRSGIPVAEQRIAAAEIGSFDELFLTGTVSEILPVVQAGERLVGDGKPGETTRRLQRLYQAALPGH